MRAAEETVSLTLLKGCGLMDELLNMIEKNITQGKNTKKRIDEQITCAEQFSETDQQ